MVDLHTTCEVLPVDHVSAKCLSCKTAVGLKRNATQYAGNSRIPGTLQVIIGLPPGNSYPSNSGKPLWKAILTALARCPTTIHHDILTLLDHHPVIGTRNRLARQINPVVGYFRTRLILNSLFSRASISRLFGGAHS